MAKKVSCLTFTVTDKEKRIIDDLRKKNYKMNQSEIVRLLINEGAKALQMQERKGA